MKSSVTLSPDIVPVLSRGRHRSARRGACFMEFASFLAGERWSDHPSCTDASLAHLARGVNDLVSDSARNRLTVLIPSVIGLVDPSERMRLVVALRAGAAALPVASETRQHTLAVGLQHLLVLTSEKDAALASTLAPLVEEALASTPTADAWARRFRAGVGARAATNLAAICRTVTSVALVGIADACIDNADDLLVQLLSGTIADCSALVEPAAVDRTEVSRTAARAYVTV